MRPMTYRRSRTIMRRVFLTSVPGLALMMRLMHFSFIFSVMEYFLLLGTAIATTEGILQERMR